MGAAASVETNLRAAYDDATNAARDMANKLQGEMADPDLKLAGHINSIVNTALPAKQGERPAVAVPDLNLEARIEKIANALGPAQRESALRILQELRDKLPIAQVGAALDQIEKMPPNLDGATMLVIITEVAKMKGALTVSDTNNTADLETPAVAVPDLNLEGRIESIANAVGPAQRESALRILHELKSKLSIAILETALDEIEKMLPNLEGAAMLVAIAGVAKAKEALAASGINADDLKKKASKKMNSMGINLPNTKTMEMLLPF